MVTAAPGWAVNSQGNGVYQIGTPDPTLSQATPSSGSITRTSSSPAATSAPQPTQPVQPPAPQTTQQPTQTQPTQQTTAPATNLQPGSQGQDVTALQDYLVQMGYLTPQQVATGPGTYGPQTTAAVAKMQQDLGVSAGGAAGDYGPKTQAALQQKYQNLYNQNNGSAPPQSAGGASSALQPYLQPTQSSDPVFNSMLTAMQPIMDSLSQVMSNINNPALTGVSLQQEYNTLAQQNNLPQMNSQLLNMQNIMNGTTQDIRDEINSAGGTATESQVMAMSSARNTVILKQYNALSTQYQAAQTNVSNMMQYATTDQSTQLAREQATTGVLGQMSGIYSNMQNMALTMRGNAVQAAQYNISQTGYQAFAKTLAGDPSMQGNYENLLGLAPGTLSNPQALASLDTYKQQSLQMTNLLRDTQLYNAGIITQLPASDANYLSGGTTGTATASQGTSSPVIDPSTGAVSSPLQQAMLSQESGATSTAVSPSGALGMYQAMPEHLPDIGIPNTPAGQQQFLNSPALQTQLYTQMMSGLNSQYGGDQQKVLAAYYGGAGGAAVVGTPQGDMPQKNGMPSINQYVQQVQSKMSNNQNSQYNAASGGITAPVFPITANGSGTQALATGSLIPPTAGPNGTQSSKAITAVTGLTPDEFNYIVKGQSALTRMPYGQQQKVKAGVQAFLAKNGVDLSTFQSQYEAYNTTLGNNIQRFNNTQIAEGEVMGTLANLNPAAANAGLGNVNMANVGKLLAGQQVNDPAANEYMFYFNDLINSLGYFYAAQQGKTSADIPDKTEAAQVIAGGLANGGIKGLQTATQATTLKMKGVLATAVDDSQKNIWTLFGVGDQYVPPGGKGKLDDKQFVANTFADQGLNYNATIAKVPAGMIGVVDNQTGDITAIDPSSFDASKYTKL